jgi:diaminopimelate decarboxylase
VCESADTFAKDIALPPLAAGDLVAFRTTGAYAQVMASNYNGRPRPAEVLCAGKEAKLIRARESLVDLWRGEYGLSGDGFDETLPSGLGDA